MKKSKSITWNSKQVAVSSIKPTPKNYKIKTELGQERLKQSLKMFGLAGTVIVNTDLSLIDGNSRLEEAKANGEKKIWVSMPSRKLTPKEYVEMSAMYDFAKAGEVDMERIEADLGSKEDFYKKWNMTVPLSLLNKLGANAKITKELEYPDEEEKALEVADVKMVQLFFTNKQEVEFRKIEEKLKKKFKTENTTDTVMRAFKFIK